MSKLRCIWFEMETDAEDNENVPDDVLATLRPGETVLNVERHLDGGYNTSWYQIWILRAELPRDGGLGS